MSFVPGIYGGGFDLMKTHYLFPGISRLRRNCTHSLHPDGYAYNDKRGIIIPSLEGLAWVFFSR